MLVTSELQSTESIYEPAQLLGVETALSGPAQAYKYQHCFFTSDATNQGSIYFKSVEITVDTTLPASFAGGHVVLHVLLMAHKQCRAHEPTTIIRG